MSNRLDSIITRTGDDGSSQLADGSRILKAHPRLCAMGDVDELNAHIGLLRSYLHRAQASEIEPQVPSTHTRVEPASPNEARTSDALLILMQHHLFEIGSELAVPGMTYLASDAVQILEQWAEHTLGQLSPLKEFILPSGISSAAQAHVCRCVARRAERSLIELDQVEPQNRSSIQYLNRCSDVFFILSRHLNQRAGFKKLIGAEMYRRHKTTPHPRAQTGSPRVASQPQNRRA